MITFLNTIINIFISMISTISEFIFICKLPGLSFCDATYEKPWFFQYPGSPIMYGLLHLHNLIIFMLSFILFMVIFFIARFIYLFHIKAVIKKHIYQNVKHYYMVRLTHNLWLELSWIIMPTLLLFALAFPSFALMYAFEMPIRSNTTLQITGHQWYWSYELTYEGGYDVYYNLKKFDYIMNSFKNVAAILNIKDENLNFNEIVPNEPVVIDFKDKGFIERTFFKLLRDVTSDRFYDLKPLKFDSHLLDEVDLDNDGKRCLKTTNPVRLPVNSNLKILLTSDDVLHSWSVPGLGIKLDAVPGRINQLNTYVNRIGHFTGQCSELCGINHAFMPIEVITSTNEDMLSWWLLNSSNEVVIQPSSQFGRYVTAKELVESDKFQFVFERYKLINGEFKKFIFPVFMSDLDALNNGDNVDVDFPEMDDPGLFTGVQRKMLLHFAEVTGTDITDAVMDFAKDRRNPWNAPGVGKFSTLDDISRTWGAEWDENRECYPHFKPSPSIMFDLYEDAIANKAIMAWMYAIFIEYRGLMYFQNETEREAFNAYITSVEGDFMNPKFLELYRVPCYGHLDHLVHRWSSNGPDKYKNALKVFCDADRRAVHPSQQLFCFDSILAWRAVFAEQLNTPQHSYLFRGLFQHSLYDFTYFTSDLCFKVLSSRGIFDLHDGLALKGGIDPRYHKALADCCNRVGIKVYEKNKSKVVTYCLNTWCGPSVDSLIRSVWDNYEYYVAGAEHMYRYASKTFQYWLIGEEVHVSQKSYLSWDEKDLRDVQASDFSQSLQPALLFYALWDWAVTKVNAYNVSISFHNEGEIRRADLSDFPHTFKALLVADREWFSQLREEALDRKLNWDRLNETDVMKALKERPNADWVKELNIHDQFWAIWCVDPTVFNPRIRRPNHFHDLIFVREFWEPLIKNLYFTKRHQHSLSDFANLYHLKKMTWNKDVAYQEFHFSHFNQFYQGKLPPGATSEDVH